MAKNQSLCLLLVANGCFISSGASEEQTCVQALNLVLHSSSSNIDIAMITEVTMSSGDEFRRHSTGKLSAGIGEQKSVPHYLRASTGSCRDCCKFRRNEETETKKRPSIPKISERKSLNRSSNEVPMIRNRTPLAKVNSREISMAKTHSKLASKMIGTSSRKPSSKDIELSDKHVISVNANAEAMDVGGGGSRSSEIKIEKKEPLEASLNRVLSFNARKHNSLKIVSHVKNQTKPRKENAEEHNEVEEKTLYILEVENESQIESPDTESSLSNSPLRQSSFEEAGVESEKVTNEFEEDTSSASNGIESMANGNNNNTLEAEEKVMVKKDETACSKEKEGQVLRKVKIFSRKMVEETKTEKRNSPRKLKLKRGSLFWNNNPKDESTQGVALRHHLKNKKNDEEALQNNVIEETANKLVEIQRSKVKALVGAFETIISQQNSNSPKPVGN
ncbi:hypothetical protein PIB30_026911 [Stylosanthes scabra]|uniref:Calmodulin-binding domain-containing protein n=1 Tax=Stylosanthes scabra TaxID=79078 RepID=A0ABU6WDK5_9FABA|nr:hypothetical protein [Stylosanthes scabra]